MKVTPLHFSVRTDREGSVVESSDPAFSLPLVFEDAPDANLAAASFELVYMRGDNDGFLRGYEAGIIKGNHDMYTVMTGLEDEPVPLKEEA